MHGQSRLFQPKDQAVDWFASADSFELTVQLRLWMIRVALIIIIRLLVVFLFQYILNAGMGEGHLQMLQSEAKSES